MVEQTNIRDIMIYEGGNGGDMAIKNDDLVTVQGLTNQVIVASSVEVMLLKKTLRESLNI